MQEQIQQKLASYKPSENAIRLVRSTKILLLVGVSGAGKDTIKHRLLETDSYHHIVSHTTRRPRANHGVMEQDGVDYHFISIEQAGDMLSRHEFIEAKMYSGNVYGTSVAEIETAHDASQIAVTDLEVQGVVEYKEISKSVVAVFMLPPDYEEWQARLKQRYDGGVVNEADINKRMHTARTELQHALDTDYFHFVINDDLETTLRTVDAIAHDQTALRREARAEKLARTLLDDLQAKL
jgi:guanylate kinase